MIVPQPDGSLNLSFADWTPEMTLLSSMLWELPRRDGDSGPPSGHELGIDRLARMESGPIAIVLMGHVVDELDHRPGEIELMRLGMTLLRLERRLDRMRHDRLSRFNGPTKPSGFVRRA